MLWSPHNTIRAVPQVRFWKWKTVFFLVTQYQVTHRIFLISGTLTRLSPDLHTTSYNNFTTVNVVFNATTCIKNQDKSFEAVGGLRNQRWRQKVLSGSVIMCEVFACLHTLLLSPFPFSGVEAEYNKALVVWACSPECPLSLTLTSFPFISSPSSSSSSFEQLPPEWLVRRSSAL